MASEKLTGKIVVLHANGKYDVYDDVTDIVDKMDAREFNPDEPGLFIHNIGYEYVFGMTLRRKNIEERMRKGRLRMGRPRKKPLPEPTGEELLGGGGGAAGNA